MSAAQAGQRRLSSRLQEKVDAHAGSNGAHTRGANKKRKNDYDEEDDGFAFSRVNKNKKPRKSKDGDSIKPTVKENARTEMKVGTTQPAPQKPEKASVPPPKDDTSSVAPPKTRRKKMSFSTPKGKDAQPVRRSKRLSSEAAQRNGSPAPVAEPGELRSARRRKPAQSSNDTEVAPASQPNQPADTKGTQIQVMGDDVETTHSATKIALPFADTPVIRRNKAMREGKSMKGDRRSSLGLRGRRASSLIETGNSNALPHQEVVVTDFYKHIESSLMEPRRMKQLLTWCATRAIHAKPIGTDFEDASAKSAARVIEEELLKELSNRSELSDWFSREDTQEPLKPLPERPNPKNVQNLQKMEELEQQINKLKLEKDALEKLLQSPEISRTINSDSYQIQDVDQSLLSAEDAALLEVLNNSSELADDISGRINSVALNLGPSIDRFADGIHKVAQYRTGTDAVAGRMLAICAEKLDSKERAGRRKALDIPNDRSPGRDLSNVLRGISKTDR